MGVDSKLIEETIANYVNSRALPKLADAAGVDYNRLRNYTRGRIKSLNAEEFARIHSIGVRDSGNIYRILNVTPTAMVDVPVVGSAAGGSGAEIHGEEYTVPVPKDMTKDDTRGWLAEGDSMSPWIIPGDVVLCLPRKTPAIGYAMLIRNEDGGMMVKAVDLNGSGIVLRSINPTYPDLPASVEFIGIVTGIYRSVGSYTRVSNDLNGLKPGL